MPVRAADRWVLGLLGLLALLFYAAVLRYAINVPQVDDFLYVDSIRRITEAGTSLPEAIRLLVEQHNDHRILLSRLLLLFDYALEGQVNYRTLTLLGSLSVAGVLWQVYRLLQRAGLAPWTLIPVALFLFQPSYQDDVWWVLCLLQHTLTLWLMVLVFRGLSWPGTGAQLGTLALAGLVLYSNSNGLFMWVAVIGLLLLSRQWRWAAIWTATGLVLISLYFSVNYHFLAGQSMTNVLQHPAWIVRSLVSFAGSAVYFDGRKWLLLPSQWLTLGVGAFALAVIAGSWVRRLLQFAQPVPPALIPALGLGFVLVCSGLAAALARSDGSLMIINRYQLYAVWCLIVVYLLLLLQTTGRWRVWVGGGTLVLAGWFWVNAWLYYGPQLGERYRWQVAEGVALKQYSYSVVSQTFGLDPYWQKGWVEAMQRGIYRVPDLPEISGIEAALLKPALADSTTRFTMDPRWLSYLNTKALFMQQDTLPKPDFLYLQGSGKQYVLPAQRLPKSIMKPFLADKGVKTMVLPVMLQPGAYRIGWLRQTPAGWQATLTRQEVQVLQP